MTPEQEALLRSLVRMAYRKTLRNEAAAREKFGAAYDGTRIDARLAKLEDVYRVLGGDPANITFLDPEDIKR